MPLPNFFVLLLPLLLLLSPTQPYSPPFAIRTRPQTPFSQLHSVTPRTPPPPPNVPPPPPPPPPSEKSKLSPKLLLLPATLILLTILSQTFLPNVTAILDSLTFDPTPSGALRFFLIYFALEILCVPCFPLTALSGASFGVVGGTVLCWTAGTLSAVIAFQVGRTVLSDFIQSKLAGQPRLKALDRAFRQDGTRVVALLRLSPIFPFAAASYLYGGTSVGLAEYSVVSVVARVQLSLV